jgi:hypothetical protein
MWDRTSSCRLVAGSREMVASVRATINTHRTSSEIHARLGVAKSFDRLTPWIPVFTVGLAGDPETTTCEAALGH